jgi:Mn2+/Fe2+ NRAMP family transporter
MFHKFKVSEIVILVLVIVIIFVSEYEFVIMKNQMQAIFIGLWPPTILALLIYVNTKLKN